MKGPLITSSVAGSILHTIGNTPLLRLSRIPQIPDKIVLAKLEGFNPGGSIKDRTAFNILNQAILTGSLKKGDTVIESSSGNMAIGLAQFCLYFGLKLIVIVDPKLNRHTAQLLQTYGVQIERVTEPSENGGYLASRLARVKELIDQNKNAFWSNQYGNVNNPLTHNQTMDEIFQATNGPVDYLFIATSTCGTLMGCANYIVNRGLPTKVIAVDAEGSILFGGKPDERIIPGHGSGVESQFLDEQCIHDYRKVTDLDCVTGCWKLLHEESILCGGSSGAVISAFNHYEHLLPKGSTSVLILSDRGDRYLDTIYDKDWLMNHFPDFQNSIKPPCGW